MQRLIAFVLALVLMLAGSLADANGAALWTEYTRFTSPFLQQLPAGEQNSAQTRRLILVLVRGLRADTAEMMPVFASLRQRGAGVIVEHEAPTWQLPVWITLFSGARTQIHGTTTNSSPRNTSIDSLFSRVSGAGQRSVIIGGALWNDLYGASAQRIEVIDADTAALRDELAIAALKQTLEDPSAPERLIVLELGLIEATGRDPAQALPAAAAATDIRLDQIQRMIDLANNTLVVLSDRGLSPFGEDGGVEPEIRRAPMVLTGAGVRRGGDAIARGIDIAPTLSQLLGVPIPAHAQGVPIWDVLRGHSYIAAARQKTSFYESWSELSRRPRFAAEVLQNYDTELRKNDTAARARFEVWQGELEQSATRQRDARLSEEQNSRLPAVLGMLAIMLLCAGVMLNNSIAPPLIGTLAFGVAWAADFYLLRGYSASFSLYPGGDPALFLAQVARDTAILSAMACTICAVLAARLCDDLAQALTATVSTLGLITTAFLAQFLWFHWRWGLAYSWTIPPAEALAAAQIALAQTGALNIPVASALPALPMPLIALLIGGIVWVLAGRARE
jgi:hypothetical protein